MWEKILVFLRQVRPQPLNHNVPKLVSKAPQISLRMINCLVLELKPRIKIC